MALRICVLASGSTGNVTAVWSDTGGILIDCGLSRKYIEEALRTVGFDVRQLKGIVITHGHGDHVGSAMITLSRMYEAPIFMHEETYNVVCRKTDCQRIAGLDRELIRYYLDTPFSIDEFDIRPFASFHSGGFVGKSHGFSITSRDHAPRPFKIGFLTDTGKVDDAMVGELADSNVLILEANHDPELVKLSKRHFLNKQWVLSDYGHLSNADHAAAVARILARSRDRGALTHVFLAHISKEHNSPQRAFEQVQGALREQDITEVQLLPTYHRKISAVLRFD